MNQVFQRRCQAVATVADFAAGSGLTSPGKSLHGRHPAVLELLAIINEIKRPNVAICLIPAMRTPARLMFRHSSTKPAHLKALQVADNLGQNDDHMLPFWPRHRAMAEGQCRPREVGYSGLFSFEVPGENRCPMPIRLAKFSYAKSWPDHMLQL